MASVTGSARPKRRRNAMGVEFRTRSPLAPPAATRWRKSRLRLRLWRLRRIARIATFSSSLTRRIVSLNLGGLAALVVGFLLLNHFRADIIQARTQSLTTQADIIAARRRRLGRRRHRLSQRRSRQAAGADAGRRRAGATTTIRWCSRSIPSASARCCTGWSRRRTRGRAFSTATGRCCSIRRR